MTDRTGEKKKQARKRHRKRKENNGVDEGKGADAENISPASAKRLLIWVHPAKALEVTVVCVHYCCTLCGKRRHVLYAWGELRRRTTLKDVYAVVQWNSAHNFGKKDFTDTLSFFYTFLLPVNLLRSHFHSFFVV